MVENLVGKKFGRLLVVEKFGKNKHGETLWKCVCDCGNERIICNGNLKRGNYKSCGCYSKEIKTTHGLSKTQIYKVWVDIKRRTNPKNSKCTGNYKKLSIKMCNEWRNDFMSFYNWSIANGYKEEQLANGYNKWTIDRIDNHGDYCPENCRWATCKQQSNNQTTNKIITYKGKKQTLSQWCDELGLRYSVINQRLFWGWDIERAFTQKIGRTNYYEYKGELLSVKQIAERTGINKKVIWERIHSGWKIEKVIEQPVRKINKKR